MAQISSSRHNRSGYSATHSSPIEDDDEFSKMSCYSQNQELKNKLIDTTKILQNFKIKAENSIHVLRVPSGF